MTYNYALSCLMLLYIAHPLIGCCLYKQYVWHYLYFIMLIILIIKTSITPCHYNFIIAIMKWTFQRFFDLLKGWNTNILHSHIVGSHWYRQSLTFFHEILKITKSSFHLVIYLLCRRLTTYEFSPWKSESSRTYSFFWLFHL